MVLKNMLLCMHAGPDTLHTAFDHSPACATPGKENQS